MRANILSHTVQKNEEDGKQYVLYHLKVFYEGISWNVTRRYSEFEKLHNQLSKVINTKKFGKFPKKLLVGNLKEDKIKERKVCLQSYIENLLNEPLVPNLQEVIEFFEIQNHWEEIKKAKINTTTCTISPTLSNNNQQIFVESGNNETIGNKAYEEQKLNDQMNEIKSNHLECNEDEEQILFVALKDHIARDESEITFKKGDIIEVLQKSAIYNNEENQVEEGDVDEDPYWVGRIQFNEKQGFFDARHLDLSKIKRVYNNNNEKRCSKKLNVLSGDIYESEEIDSLDGTIKVCQFDYEGEFEDEISVQRGQKVKILSTSHQDRKGWKLVELMETSEKSTGYIPIEYLAFI
ncbi:hypothetical protein ABK040_005817 [Willaertia magna]